MRTPAPLTRSVSKAKGQLDNPCFRTDNQIDHHRRSLGSCKMHLHGHQLHHGNDSGRKH